MSLPLRLGHTLRDQSIAKSFITFVVLLYLLGVFLVLLTPSDCVTEMAAVIESRGQSKANRSGNPQHNRKCKGENLISARSEGESSRVLAEIKFVEKASLAFAIAS